MKTSEKNILFEISYIFSQCSYTAMALFRMQVSDYDYMDGGSRLDPQH